MDNHHFFYILSLWMITTFSASSNGQSPLFLTSCLWVIATHSAKKKSKPAGLAQQNGFSPAYLFAQVAC
jgi:hypothetical protein